MCAVRRGRWEPRTAKTFRSVFCRPGETRREALGVSLPLSLSDTFIAGQFDLLERIARGAPLSEMLEGIVLLIEGQTSGMMASVLLVDQEERCVRYGAAPNLPALYASASTAWRSDLPPARAAPPRSSANASSSKTSRRIPTGSTTGISRCRMGSWHAGPAPSFHPTASSLARSRCTTANGEVRPMRNGSWLMPPRTWRRSRSCATDGAGPPAQ